MAFKKTTHELATLLEEVVSSLRELPDLPLEKLKELCRSELVNTERILPRTDLDELIEEISNSSRAEVESRLNKLTSKSLLELCKKVKIKVGSSKAKANLVKQILWSFFDAKADLDRITSY